MITVSTTRCCAPSCRSRTTRRRSSSAQRRCARERRRAQRAPEGWSRGRHQLRGRRAGADALAALRERLWLIPRNAASGKAGRDRFEKVRETFPTVSDDPRSMRLPMGWERAFRRSAGWCATGAPRAKAALRSRFVWVPSRKGVCEFLSQQGRLDGRRLGRAANGELRGVPDITARVAPHVASPGVSSGFPWAPAGPAPCFWRRASLPSRVRPGPAFVLTRVRRSAERLAHASWRPPACRGGSPTKAGPRPPTPASVASGESPARIRTALAERSATPEGASRARWRGGAQALDWLAPYPQN